MNKEMVLEHWYFSNGCVSGNVYGSSIFKDGERVLTSPVVKKYQDMLTDRTLIKTLSGSIYVLGKPFAQNDVKEITPIKEPGYSLELLIASVEQWADDRGIFANSTPKDQALKTVSEVGEFADNVLKGRDCRDDIGDIIVTLILQCKLQGTTIRECLQLAYNEISSRKGKMVNGTFVKEEDLTQS